MKNILHVIDVGGPGGAETVFVELIRRLDRSRWHSVAAVPDRGWTFRMAGDAGVEPLVIPERSRSFDLSYLLQLIRTVRDRRIDLIHSHLLVPSLYGSIAGILCRIPVLSTFHGYHDIAPNERYRALKLGLIQRGSPRIVFVSEALRTEVLAETGIDPRRTAVVPNGIDVEAFAPKRDTSLREAYGIAPGDFLVGALGNVRPAKSYDVLLRAAALLAPTSPSYRFIIVGDRSDRGYGELLKLRAALGLEDRVVFTGFLPDASRVLNNFDVFVQTSRQEGFSLVTVQAMACGVPVIVTRSGGPEGIVTHEVDGLLVDVGAPDQVAAGIERLRRELPGRVRLARAGIESVRSRFGVDMMIRGYERLYDDLLHAAS